jgi:hypothetical protein
MTINRLNQDVTYLPAFRNLLINGAMQVAQRGTSATGITTSGYYTVDRWGISISSLGTWTQTVENDAPTGSGFAKSLKILCTTADATPAASDFLAIEQRIEGQNLQSIRKGTSSAQQLTLSFWVKSNVTGTYVLELRDVDNTRQVSAAYSVVSSNTWEKKTIVFPADTTGVLDNDNLESLRVNFWQGAGSDRTSGTLNTTWATSVNANRAVGQTNLAAATNNYWQVTGVQLEVGAVATPFEFKPFAQELIECQRYLPAIIETVANRIVSGFGPGSNNSVNASMPFNFMVKPRVAPTGITVSAAGDFQLMDTISSPAAITAFTITYTGEDYVLATVTVASGITAHRPYAVRTLNASGGKIFFTGCEL